MSLRPCASCRRLVRTADVLCPFCSSAAGAVAAPASPPLQRRARAALLAGALTVAAGTAACTKEPGMVGATPLPDVSDAGPSAITPEPVPSEERVDAGHGAVTPPPVGPVAMYGAPPAPISMYGAAPLPNR